VDEPAKNKDAQKTSFPFLFREGGEETFSRATHLVRKQVPRLRVRLAVAPNHILDRRAHKEVLLLQPELLALVSAVVRIKHARQGLRPLLRQDRLHVIARVERLEIKLRAGFRGPKTQVDAVARAEARDRVVVRDGRNRLPCVPPVLLFARGWVLVHRNVPVKLDGVGDDEALDLPGVAKGEPVVGLLVLEAVDDRLWLLVFQGVGVGARERVVRGRPPSVWREEPQKSDWVVQDTPTQRTWRNMPYE
jgi:hypothetical protein